MQTLLNTLIGLEADKPLMLTWPHGNTPVRRFHISGIGALVQKLKDAVIENSATALGREQRIVLKPSHDIGLTLKPPGRKTLKRFLNDRGDRLIAHKHFSASRDTLVLIASRRLKDEVSIHHPCAHTVLGLLPVFLALVLGDAGEQVFHED